MNDKHFSFEFFPAQTDAGQERLHNTREKLSTLNPEFFSVTYGAGGSTQKYTMKTVLDIQKNSGIPAAPHLSCVGSSERRLMEVLETYKNNDIRRIVALRGDYASGLREIGEFNYASDLVKFIRKKTGDYFALEVAAYPEMHPEAENFEKDLHYFAEKVRAGANSAITQYFYNVDAYCYFVDRCEKMGLDIPIIPGIMPITNYTQLARFSDSCGAEIPRWLRQQLIAFGDDKEAIVDFGTETVTRLCEKLLANGAPGLHFYTMNRAEPTMTIWHNLGLAL